MARIEIYERDDLVNVGDKLLGSDFERQNETRNYRIIDILRLLPSYDLVLSGSSYVSQIPSGLGVALQVTFGAAQGTVNDRAMLSSSGVITINTAGNYIFHGFGNFEKVQSGNTCVVMFRSLINGTQAGITKCVHIKDGGDSIPYEVTLPITATAGMQITWEIVRDPAGSNAGQLAIHSSGVAGWGNVPSASFDLYKLTEYQGV